MASLGHQITSPVLADSVRRHIAPIGQMSDLDRTATGHLGHLTSIIVICFSQFKFSGSDKTRCDTVEFFAVQSFMLFQNSTLRLYLIRPDEICRRQRARTAAQPVRESTGFGWTSRPAAKAENGSDPNRLSHFFLGQRVRYLRRRQVPRHRDDDDSRTAIFKDGVA